MRDLFDIDPETINLNSGTMSVTPKPVQQAVLAETERYNRLPAMSLFETWGTLWKVQSQLAKFFGADPNHLFIRQNVTYVLNDILLSIKLPKKSEVLTCQLEYGAIVNMLKWKCQSDDLALRVFQLSENDMSSEETLLKKIESELKPTTSLLMLSHVMTGNGLTLPIEKIGKICRAKGIKFVVDGAHGAGALDLNFAELTSVDAYGTNLHKWMMGPKGTGFGWVHPELRSALHPCFAGWTSFETPVPFQPFAGDRFAQQWMMSSTNSFQAILSLPHIIEFWHQHGANKIRSLQKERLEQTRRHIEGKTGWRCLSQFSPELCGPMVAFELPDHLAERGYSLTYDLYKKHQVLIAMTIINGRFAMRFAPQVYNTEAEILRAAEILSSI